MPVVVEKVCHILFRGPHQDAVAEVQDVPAGPGLGSDVPYSVTDGFRSSAWISKIMYFWTFRFNVAFLMSYGCF